MGPFDDLGFFKMTQMDFGCRKNPLGFRLFRLDIQGEAEAGETKLQLFWFGCFRK